MTIVKAYPPNYDQITTAIPAVRKNRAIVFTYGDKLYVPSGAVIPDHLMAHEETHTIQQSKVGIEIWWAQYLLDPHFRLEQEVEAYQAQYKILLSNYSRHWRRYILAQIVKDLAGPMYGNLIDEDEARQLITEVKS